LQADDYRKWFYASVEFGDGDRGTGSLGAKKQSCQQAGGHEWHVYGEEDIPFGRRGCEGGVNSAEGAAFREGVWNCFGNLCAELAEVGTGTCDFY
jgi:hypothetical protein